MSIIANHKLCRVCGAPVDHVICTACGEKLDHWDTEHPCGDDQFVKYCFGCERPEAECPCVLAGEAVLA